MRVDAGRDGGTGVTEHARDGDDAFVSVYAVLAVDGAVEIIYVELG
jgi:hypothetical protein